MKKYNKKIEKTFDDLGSYFYNKVMEYKLKEKIDNFNKGIYNGYGNGYLKYKKEGK